MSVGTKKITYKDITKGSSSQITTVTPNKQKKTIQAQETPQPQNTFEIDMKAMKKDFEVMQQATTQRKQETNLLKDQMKDILKVMKERGNELTQVQNGQIELGNKLGNEIGNIHQAITGQQQQINELSGLIREVLKSKGDLIQSQIVVNPPKVKKKPHQDENSDTEMNNSLPSGDGL